jgi:hypothetical protein
MLRKAIACAGSTVQYAPTVRHYTQIRLHSIRRGFLLQDPGREPREPSLSTGLAFVSVFGW